MTRHCTARQVSTARWFAGFTNLTLGGTSVLLLALVVSLELTGNFASAEVVPEEIPDAGYVSLYGFGTKPRDTTISGPGANLPASFRNQGTWDFGVGVKVGYFPAFTGRVLGIEGELAVDDLSVEIKPGLFRRDFTVLNPMVNLVARFPGSLFQPYVGIGAGGSLAIVDTGVNDIGYSAEFAYQAFAGLRFNIGKVIAKESSFKNLFLFAEYKSFSTNYDWDDRGDRLSMDYRTQSIGGGFGVSF
jgi:opacity protein-like surface antigen